MRSGTGRHRRPRQAPAILVTAGVTSAGLALPLLGASGAQAVDETTWDRVAECESGGTWSVNEESGYYGGLQLTLKTWKKYGGTVYAERPDLASRSQQMAVAEKILAEEGPEAWPACALSSGLTEEVNEEPGLELPTPDPDESDDADQPDEKPDESDSEKPEKPDDESDDSDNADENVDDTDTPDPDAPGDTSVPSTEPSPDDADDAASGKPGKGGDQGNPDDADTDDDRDDADEDKPGNQAPDEQPGKGKGKGKHRGQPDPVERDRDEPGHPDRSGRADGRYLVERGDSLSSIAAKNEIGGGWPALYADNERIVGGDPDLIRPGQLLDIGGSEK